MVRDKTIRITDPHTKTEQTKNLYASEITVTRRFKKPQSLKSCSQFNVIDYKAIDITHLAKGIPVSDGFS